MGGFIKGITVGALSFVLGFAVLSVVFPPPGSVAPGEDAATATTTPESPETAPAAIEPGAGEPVPAADPASDTAEAPVVDEAPLVDELATTPSPAEEEAAEPAPAVSEPALPTPVEPGVEGGAAPGEPDTGTAANRAPEPAALEPPADTPAEPLTETVAEPATEPPAEAEDAPAAPAPPDAAPHPVAVEPQALPEAPADPELQPGPQPEPTAPAPADQTEPPAADPAPTEPPAAPEPQPQMQPEPQPEPGTGPAQAPVVRAPPGAGAADLPGQGARVIALGRTRVAGEAEPGGPAEPAGPREPGAPVEVEPVPATVTPGSEPLLPREAEAAPAPEAPAVAVRRGIGEGAAQGPAGGSTIRLGAGASSRLPSIGAAPAASREFDETLPAFLRYAARVSLPAGSRPLGIVLLDDAGAEAAITDLPLAVTVALDPFDPTAAQRGWAYRAAGHEIALLTTGLPAGASAQDVVVTLNGWQSAFPEVVAYLDVEDAGLASQPQLAREFAAMVEPDGYGVIARGARGDALWQAARAEQLAAAALYRVLDAPEPGGGAAGEITIRRRLDRAAFEAERRAGILVAGSAANPDTIAALSAFATEGRAGIALAPASLVLQGQ